MNTIRFEDKIRPGTKTIRFPQFNQPGLSWIQENEPVWHVWVSPRNTTVNDVLDKLYESGRVKMPDEIKIHTSVLIFDAEAILSRSVYEKMERAFLEEKFAEIAQLDEQLNQKFLALVEKNKLYGIF